MRDVAAIFKWVTRKVWLAAAPGHPRWEGEGGTVDQLVGDPGLLEWQSRKLAEGEKGPIVAGFARVGVFLRADRRAGSERWLFPRNNPDGQIKYALSNAPADLPMRELIRVSIARWPIECCFQEGKSELGLDHYEHRSWPAWHRHMRLVFLAQLFLLLLRQKYKKAPALTLSQARRLMEWSLPWRRRDGVYVLELIRYHQGRNHQAYLSHRQRRLRELRQWKDLSGLPHE